jgi:hypothetical protein
MVIIGHLAVPTVRGFPGTLRRPEAFAYVKTKPGGPFPVVTGVSVKKPISNTPQRDPLLVGTFWFKTSTLLAEGIEELIQRDERVNGELYLDSVFNTLIAAGKKVRAIPLQGYINWGDPDSLAEALYWRDQFTNRDTVSPRPRYPGVFDEAH